MARGGKKVVAASAAADPVAEERARLKELAFAKNVLSHNPSKVKPSIALAPSKTLIKHHGKDILRKSQRKNRYLFSFPGLLGPISGGKIGELIDLGTKNPILYLDFPQGQMKLFGTITYPKNMYLTMQFSKGGKNVTCDDYFDNMVVFSDAWWIGTKDENPEELRLEFPKELMDKQAEPNFKSGIGVTCDRQQGSGSSSKKCLQKETPELNLEDTLTDSPDVSEELVGVTPARHSARTAGKTFKFAEASSGDDLIGSEAEISEEENDKVDSETIINAACIEFKSLSPIALDFDDQNAANEDLTSAKNKRTAKTKDPSSNDHTPLVQTTLSTMFRKVEEKKAQKDVKQKINNPKKTKFATSVTVSPKKSKGKASGVSSSKKGRAGPVSTSQSSDPIDSSQAEDDEIEDFSSTSQDMDASDDDWTA